MNSSEVFFPSTKACIVFWIVFLGLLPSLGLVSRELKNVVPLVKASSGVICDGGKAGDDALAFEWWIRAVCPSRVGTPIPTP